MTHLPTHCPFCQREIDDCRTRIDQLESQVASLPQVAPLWSSWSLGPGCNMQASHPSPPPVTRQMKGNERDPESRRHNTEHDELESCKIEPRCGHPFTAPPPSLQREHRYDAHDLILTIMGDYDSGRQSRSTTIGRLVELTEGDVPAAPGENTNDGRSGVAGHASEQPTAERSATGGKGSATTDAGSTPASSLSTPEPSSRKREWTICLGCGKVPVNALHKCLGREEHKIRVHDAEKCEGMAEALGARIMICDATHQTLGREGVGPDAVLVRCQLGRGHSCAHCYGDREKWVCWPQTGGPDKWTEIYERDQEINRLTAAAALDRERVERVWALVKESDLHAGQQFIFTESVRNALSAPAKEKK